MDWLIAVLLILLVIDRIWFHKWYKKKCKRVKPRNIGELVVNITANTDGIDKAIRKLKKQVEQLEKKADSQKIKSKLKRLIIKHS